jgi:hypothetical protein
MMGDGRDENEAASPPTETNGWQVRVSTRETAGLMEGACLVFFSRGFFTFVFFLGLFVGFALLDTDFQ